MCYIHLPSVDILNSHRYSLLMMSLQNLAYCLIYIIRIIHFFNIYLTLSHHFLIGFLNFGMNRPIELDIERKIQYSSFVVGFADFLSLKIYSKLTGIFGYGKLLSCFILGSYLEILL